MGWWQVNADTLAGSRFVISPLAETFASLKALSAGTAAHPGERAWLNAHLPDHQRRLAADPVTAALVRAGLGPEWIADFLTPTPRGPLPAILRGRDDLPGRAADLLTHLWTEAVRPYWPRRRRVLEADVVARTAQLSQGGWAAALDAMRPGMRWLGENRLQVNLHEYPPREISGAELLFVPVTPQRHGWVSWEEPDRYAVVYPCSGVLAHTEPSAAHAVHSAGSAAPESLGRLLGTARAGVLARLDSPMSTSQLVAVTGQGLGSVGRHLKVLLDARLVRRRRAGRSVLYYRTAAGEVLLRAQGAARVPTDRS